MSKAERRMARIRVMIPCTLFSYCGRARSESNFSPSPPLPDGEGDIWLSFNNEGYTLSVTQGEGARVQVRLPWIRSG